MPPDWKLLADLNPGDLQATLLAQADAVMNGQPGPEEDRLLPSLPEPVRATWLLGWLDYEVSQGSLLAYFYNSHGRHARLAAGVLRRIGADRMADVVAEADASCERACGEWAARRAETDAGDHRTVAGPSIGLSNARDLGRLTGQYWKAAADEDWAGKLGSYLQEQVALLAR
ncbi:MAG TPA: DUF4375 domain-containing protein [Trebonia sp.]|nr:DUF4375 domain-containing protein [Trebonia sp.]